MKKTRLIYTDERHIEMCKAMPAEQFKEYMLAIMEYQYGDDSILDRIKDPMVKALFIAEKQHIDFNEEKYEKRAAISRINGAKSKGRPKKEEQEVSVYSPTEEEIKEILTEDDNKKDMGNYIGYIKEERTPFTCDNLSNSAVNFINAYRDEWDKFIIMFRNAAYKRDQGRLDMAIETIAPKLEVYTNNNTERSEALWKELWEWLIQSR